MNTPDATTHATTGATMTAAQARAILGPDLCADIDAHPVAPLSEAQLARLVPILLAADSRASDTATAA